jgi:hypothetical protein
MQHDRVASEPSLKGRLQNLPDERQPYGFGEFQRRAGKRSAARAWLRAMPRLPFAARLTLTLAAAAVLAVLGLSLLGDLVMEQRGMIAARDLPGAPASGDAASAVGGSAAPAEAMESWLISLPAEPAVVRVGSRAAAAGLEDRIALLDDVLSAERAAHAQPARLWALEQQRGQLLRSLVQVRYAEGLAAESF